MFARDWRVLFFFSVLFLATCTRAGPRDPLHLLLVDDDSKSLGNFVIELSVGNTSSTSNFPYKIKEKLIFAND